MSNPLEAEYRIVREENGQYHVECKDRAVSWFYIVASHLGTGLSGLHNAVKYCEKHFEFKNNN